MPTLNVCVQIYMNKKRNKIYKKYKYFSSVQNLCQRIYKASEKKKNICTFYKRHEA